MKLDFTPIFAAFGIGLATYFVLRLRNVKPDVKFKDVRYNELKNEIQLVIENVSDGRVFVKPALRLVRLTPADEWRAKTSNWNSPVPMMTASAGSVIKGYELLGEYAEPVAVDAKATVTITYPIMRDFGLKAYDNIKVDSLVGHDPYSLEGSISKTLRMNTVGLLSEEGADELLSVLNEQLRADRGVVSVHSVVVFDGGVDLKSQSHVPAGVCVAEAPVDGGQLEAVRSGFPVQSLCYCCGKERWLSWVVGGNHVCQDCKDFLGGAEKTLVRRDLAADEFDDGLESGDLDLGVEFVESQSVDLKPRHRKILDALLSESTVSIKELSSKLGRDQKSVATDLRYLLKNNLVDRVKIRGKYKYFSLRDEGQVVVLNSGEAGEEQPPWN
jgi:hypothetical protein